MSEISLALRLSRVAVGKSQWQISQSVGMHPVLLNSIERGRRVPNATQAQCIMRALKQDAPDSRLVAMVLAEADKIIKERLK